MTNNKYADKLFLIIDNLKPSHDVLKKFAISLTAKKVDSTYQAKDALPLCLEKRYDVIFLGYDLGERQKNGQQLLEELRLSEVISRHCIVIMITAEVSQEMVLAALEHKPDCYLCKPYTVSELSRRLNNCYRKKQSMASIYQALEDDDKNLAISLVNDALKNNTPYKSECLGIKSRQLFDLREYKKAKEIYLDYQNEKNCTWANIGLGKVAIEENKLSDAITIFQTVIEQKPLYLPGYDWLSSTYEKKFETIFAEEALEQALVISPRSVPRLKKYAGICYDNEHFEKATNAYSKVCNLASNSIHHCPENTLLFAKSLASYSSDLPLVEAKKLNNKAFSMLSQVIKSFNQPEIRIQSHLLSACLLENVNENVIANTKLDLGLKLLDREQFNIDDESLNAIASTLVKLKRNTTASQLLISAKQQEEVTSTLHEKEEDSTAEFKENYTTRAQKALNTGKKLFVIKDFDGAIDHLTKALELFPSHVGIKLNLLHILLGVYEDDKQRFNEMSMAKKLILSLINTTKSNEEKTRFRKIKLKYQQLV